MTTVYDVSQVRARLTERITSDGYRKVAADFDVTEAFLRMVANGTRDPGPAILAGLGLVKAYIESPRRTARAK